MSKSYVKASTLRIVMMIMFILVATLSASGFYYTQDSLRKMAADHATKSDTNNTASKTTQEIEQDIASHKEINDKAAAFVASSNFLGEIKNNLDRYAANTNVQITNISQTNAPTSISPQIIAGVNSQYISITLENPIIYNNLLKFIKAIETNIPKMNLQGISIKSKQDSTNSVDVDPLIVEVFVR